MIKLIALLITLPAWAAPTPPPAMPGGLQAGGIARVFAAQDRVAWMGEYAAATQSADRKPKQYTLGWYYSFTENWKVGGFVRSAHGLRHDEDWHSVNGVWQWNQSNGRDETFLIGDVTGKFTVASNWVAELKTRYLYNAFNDNRTLLLRPGISYFWMDEGRLIANFFAQLELDFALNYGTQALPEKWLYLGALYHLNSNFDLGPFVSLGWQSWGRPQGYADKGGAPYTVTTQSTTLGLIFIANL